MADEQRSPILDAVPTGAAEGELITQNAYGAVRTLAEQGVPKKAIARQLDLDIKTVRKWLRRSWAPGKRRARETYSETVPTPTAQDRAIARWRIPRSYFSRRTSRNFLIGSRFAPIRALLRGGGPKVRHFRYRRVITIAGIGDQDPRNG